MNILLGSGHQDFVLQRTGPYNDVITDFKSIYFSSSLTGAQETPPNGSTATGTATASLNFAQTRFAFALDINGLDLDGNQTGAPGDDVTDMHIHDADPGAPGPIIFHFLNDSETVVDAAAGTVTGGWDTNETDAGAEDMSAANVATLLADGAYFNIHSATFGGGEIRGQILQQDNGLDQIDLTELNIGNFATLLFLIQNFSGDARITHFFNGSAMRLTLDGLTEADLLASDFIFAGAVNETINGTGLRDDLFGAGGNDRVVGGSGTDRIFGENGNDALFGGNDNDRLDGGVGIDSIFGQAGNDTIIGGGGNDRLTGDVGADLLTGGAGLDIMSGGTDANADRFDFNSIGDSGASNATADRILDFDANAEDRIDVATIDARTSVGGNQAFAFVGTGPFTAEGQIRVVQTATTTFVHFNTTGNAGSEMIIRLNGVVNLDALDFVL